MVAAIQFAEISRWTLGDNIKRVEHGLQTVDWSRGDKLDRLAGQFVSQIASVRGAENLGVGGFDERERYAEDPLRLTVPAASRILLANLAIEYGRQYKHRGGETMAGMKADAACNDTKNLKD